MRIAAARGYLRHLTNWIVKPQKPKELLPLPIVETAQPRTRPRLPIRQPVYQEPSSFVAKHETAFSVCSDTTENLASSTEGRTDETAETRRSIARRRFANAIRSVMMLRATARPTSPYRNPSFETPIGQSAAVVMSPRFPDPGMSLRGVRVASAIDKLKALDTSQEMAAHQALVRHLQFSPNGKYLATSRYVTLPSADNGLTNIISWDRTSVIFRVGVSYLMQCSLLMPIKRSGILYYAPHTGARPRIHWSGRLVCCRFSVHVTIRLIFSTRSPNGKILLTRLTRAVKVWSEVRSFTSLPKATLTDLIGRCV